MAACGFYGKIPSEGDFVTRRLPWEFTSVWDAWLQQGMLASRDALGASWLERYLSAPVWRFQLAPGVCGPTGWRGLFFAGVDRVGRYFPLTLAFPEPPGGSITASRAALSADEPGWLAFEDTALGGLDPACGIEAFDLAVQALAAPAADAGGVAEEGAHAAVCFFTRGSAEFGETFLPLTGLLPASGFVRLITSAAPARPVAGDDAPAAVSAGTAAGASEPSTPQAPSISSAPAELPSSTPAVAAHASSGAPGAQVPWALPEVAATPPVTEGESLLSMISVVERSAFEPQGVVVATPPAAVAPVVPVERPACTAPLPPSSASLLSMISVAESATSAPPASEAAFLPSAAAAPATVAVTLTVAARDRDPASAPASESALSLPQEAAGDTLLSMISVAPPFSSTATTLPDAALDAAVPRALAPAPALPDQAADGDTLLSMISVAPPAPLVPPETAPTPVAPAPPTPA